MSRLLGKIEEVWRYPVSSLGGEKLLSVELDEHGVPGDRVWGIVDSETGAAAAPEKEGRWRAALFLHSRLQRDLPEIGFPDREWLCVEDKRLSTKLSEHFSFAVEARPYHHDDRLSESMVRATNRYEPSPFHLVTTGSMAHLCADVASGGVSSRRFRPTVVLRTEPGPEFEERSWVGHIINIGATKLKVTAEAKRCGMTLIPQPGLDEAPDILRSIVRRNKRNFGIYCAAQVPGIVSVDDEVWLLES